jgi:hypothetical protein
MSFGELTGPVIHIGVPGALALLLRLNPIVAITCGILPDVIDKPLAGFGIGGGRYIGHTLLVAVVVIAAFSLWKRKYGLAALIGLASHLLLDLNNLVPWFFPFKDYNFSVTKLNIMVWLKGYVTFSHVGLEVIVVALVGIIAFICWWLYRRYTRRKKKKSDVIT